jgi:hypothetical protein
MAGGDPRRKLLFSLSHILNFCNLSNMIFRLKQPQQRYDDADLYKPRPVITPSSRRSRRHDDS